jgi:hypothetical protein
MFHVKYLSFSSLCFLKEDFVSFYNIYRGIRKINDPQDKAIFDPGLLFEQTW